MTTVTYPFDPMGSNPLNRIVNEQHVLTSLNDTQLYQTVIPKAAPFFSDNAVLSFRNPDSSVRTLTEGVDYYFTNKFISASKATAKPVFGSITFLDKDITGVLRLTYQTMGGVWTLEDNVIATILANMVKNPRTTAWEQITELPMAFPVIDHEWDLVDMVGAAEMVVAIDGIRDAVLAASAGGIGAHVADKNNPHETSKAQVGLGDVQNYPIATQAQSETGTNNTSYMTPQRTAQAITVLGDALVTAHAINTNNPHGVTKAQVGLGNVANYPMATASEAVAGISTTTYMSPSATKAVADLISTSVSTHIADQMNPHNVSKAQVGLFNVENYPVATAQEAQAGVLNDRYMTPLRVKQAITALASVELSTHTSDFNNPHSVTKAQVGLVNVENYEIATQVESESGVVSNKYMTPLRTAQAITAQVGQSFLTHLNATNPHGITKAEIGLGGVQNYDVATQAEAEQGVVSDKYMTPQRTAQAIAFMASSNVSIHAGRTDNPHNVTAAQVGAYSIADVDTRLASKLDETATAVNSNLLQGRNAASIVSEAYETTMDAVNLGYTRQIAIPQTTYNPLLQDAVWVKIGTLSYDSDTADENGVIQWVITGGGFTNYTDTRKGSQLKSMLVSAAIWPEIDGGTETIRYTIGAQYLSNTPPNAQSSVFELWYSVNVVTNEIVVYVKVPNGHTQITVTDLSRYNWSEITPDELGDVAPADAILIPINYGSQHDPEVIQLRADLQNLTNEVRDSFNAIRTAVATSYPAP